VETSTMMNNNLESALKQNRMQHFQRGNEVRPLSRDGRMLSIYVQVVEVHPMDVTGNNELGARPDDNDEMLSYARAEDVGVFRTLFPFQGIFRTTRCRLAIFDPRCL
jgi:hypothetical protein